MKNKLVAMAEKAILEKELLVNNVEENLEEKKDVIFGIIPELKEEDGFDQKNPWHIYDVWKHTLMALHFTQPDLEIRLALLLHDIGKPYCYQEDGDIRHFKGHAKKSEEMSREILKRIGYKQNIIDRICYLIENHSTVIDVDKVTKENLEITKKLLFIQYCDSYAYNLNYAHRVFNKLKIIEQDLLLKEKEFNKQENEEER